MRIDNKGLPEGSTSLRPIAPENDSLLVISQFYWPEKIGTAPYVTDIAQWISRKMKQVTVVTGHPYYPEFRLKVGYEDESDGTQMTVGVSIVRLPTYVPTGGKAARRIISEVIFLLGVLSRIVCRKLNRQEQVISVSPSIAAVVSGILCTKRGGRHVAVIHDIQSGLAAGLGMVGSGVLLRLFRCIERNVLNRIDAIIVLTSNMESVLREMGVVTPIAVLPIWVDLNEFKFMPIRKNKPLRIQYSGNLGRKQGIEQVLDLADILLKVRPDIRIQIRGSGSQFDFVQREIERRGLINTELTPLLPRGQLPGGLSEADIHLVPQNPNAADYAVPSKIYAILAIGRPIIATALPGSALWDLQDKTNGAIACAPPNNPDELTKTIIELLDNEATREEMGRSGRQYVEENAARDVILNQYLGTLYGRAQIEDAPKKQSQREQ